MKAVKLTPVCSAYLCALLLSILISPSFVYAQTQAAQTPSAERVAVTIVSVKPEMVADFENMIKNETNPALAKGGAKWRNVWQTATFGDLFEYVIAAPVDNYAQYDSPSPMEKGLGKEGFAAWRAKASRMVNKVHTYAIEAMPELSYNAEMAGLPKMAVVTFVHVAPGRVAEYENHIKNDLLPVIKKSGIAGYWVNRTRLGGDTNEYIILALHENYAEIDKGPPVARVLGREGALKLWQKLPAGVVMHQENRVMRYAPELSYRPAQTANR